MPTITSIPRSTKAKVMNRPSNRVTCSTRAKLTMLADTSMRNVVIRVRTSFWAMVRVESKLQCSVARSWARTAGGAPPPGGELASEGYRCTVFSDASGAPDEQGYSERYFLNGIECQVAHESSARSSERYGGWSWISR